MLDYFKNHPECSMVYGRGICVDENGNFLRDYHNNCSVMDFNPDILKWECFILQPAAFIKTDVLKSTGDVDESLHWCMDWDLWLRIAKRHTVNLFPAYWACWRQYEGIKSNEPDFRMFRERFSVMKAHGTVSEYMIGRWYYLGRYPGFLRMIAKLKYKKSGIKQILYYIYEKLMFHFFRMVASFSGFTKDGSSYRKLAVFTPLLPLKTGIATYFTDLLIAMLEKEKNLLIDIYINNNYTPSDIYRHERIRIIDHLMFNKNVSFYKTILYQMGNNYEFHYYMIPYIKRYGGVVEMHDILINAIYNRLSTNFKSAIQGICLRSVSHYLISYPELRFYAYKKLLGKDHQYLEKKLYSRTLPVRKADRIIIRDYENIKRFNLPKRKCSIIIHGVTIGSLADENRRKKIRKSLGIPADAFVVLSAGIIHNNKRIDRVLEALGRICDRIPRLVYVLAGESHWQGEDINDVIVRYNLKKMVRVTGWLSLNTWKDYISVCDVGVNLRGNSSGEHSGPMAQFMQQGKPILISDYDQFRSFPDECTIKIPHGEHEVEKIAEGICRLYRDIKLRKAMGVSARNYAKSKLSFETISEQYMCVLGLNNTEKAK